MGEREAAKWVLVNGVFVFALTRDYTLTNQLRCPH